jgi:hypothetical protein
MKNKITAPEQVKPIFSINELDILQDIKADIQSLIDDLMKGNLLRGFWFK